MSMVAAAKEAGIDTYHGTVKRMMENRHYMGDDFYPAIIDVNTFTEAMLERQRRAKKLGRTDRIKPPVKKTSPTTFTLGTIKEFYDDPAKQAEYLYSLIESEAT
ncbi:integrase [Butyricicoccus porcorum]